MDNGIHFISGLPRAGSTLLAALLRQNPRFHAGMTSPVGALFNAMLRETSQRNEGAVFIDDEVRMRLLRACFEAFYADVHPKKLVFDTNRLWTTRLAALASLYPGAKMVCCVRNPAWVVDSVERLVRRNRFELSGIFGFETGGTVYARADGLNSDAGMLGFGLKALREAVYGEQADRLLLVRYETLTTNPIGTLAAIYDFIGEELFSHDPDHIEAFYDGVEFDARIGTPGLHKVRSAVRPTERTTILPPDLFDRFTRDAFWQDLSALPKAVRLI
ncbi:MAG TPA: sulfotransferase [Acetobacteraceae bacterium]